LCSIAQFKRRLLLGRDIPGRMKRERNAIQVAAFVALKAGEGADKPGIIAVAREKLVGYKVPKSMRFIDEVPKSLVGKLLRRAVRDPFWAGRERRIG
jgi:acyl-coenzyme A synthetase/AMP-(fatty) acid ligase